MKAIALISGGLDSILAARLIEEQGIGVLPLHFKIPFCHQVKTGNLSDSKVASLVANNLGLKLKTLDISQEFLKLLTKPKHGFGSNMNPCIDCKILMLSKAKELMQECFASFVISGEVLGQRPMSQHRKALELISQESGLENLLLRPLSARLLAPTTPEKEGWVDRNRLLNFNGRSRRSQIELAKNLKITNYSNPAGGCLLTDPEFSQRLKDLITHKELSIENVELLKIGRHFRIAQNTKLVVGRDEKENERIFNLARENDYLFFPTQELAGPTSLGRGKFNPDLLRLAGEITCRYCDLNGKKEVDLLYREFPEKEDNILTVSSIEEDKLKSLRL